MMNLLILLLIIAVIFVILGFLGKIAWTILKWIIIVVIIAMVLSWFIRTIIELKGCQKKLQVFLMRKKLVLNQ